MGISKIASGVQTSFCSRAGAFSRVLLLCRTGPRVRVPHVAALGLWVDGVACRLAENKNYSLYQQSSPTKIMPSKFAKVTKQVSKKKGGALALHENSRDALRLRAAVARDDRVARLGAVREKLNDQYRMFCHDYRLHSN
jgi:hypothetical protein